jgi:hypothetical protein
MRLLRMLTAAVCLSTLLSGLSFAQSACPTFPNPSCGGAGQTACPVSNDPMADINAARARETPPLGPLVLPPAYASAPADQKIIMLINAERRSRNIPAINDDADDTDAIIGYMAENHSQLLSDISQLFSEVNAHTTAIDGTPSDRLSTLPGSENFGGSAEIIAVTHSPEAADFFWVYNDASGNWGHRGAVLHCDFKIAGAGVATGASVQVGMGSTAKIYTVDFIDNPNNAYKLFLVPPGTPRPEKPAASATYEWLNTTSNTTLKIKFSSAFQRAYGFDNRKKWIYVFPRARWGKASGTVPPLGTYPVGMGGVPCNITSAVGGTGFDGGGAYTCEVTLPPRFPIEIDAVDLFSRVTRLRNCPFSGEAADPTPCFVLGPPTPPNVDMPRR